MRIFAGLALFGLLFGASGAVVAGYGPWEQFSNEEIRRLNAEILERHGVRIEANRWLCKGEPRGTINNAEFGMGWSRESILRDHEKVLKNFLEEAKRIQLGKVKVPENAFFSVSYLPAISTCELIGVVAMPISNAVRMFNTSPGIQVSFGVAPLHERFDPTDASHLGWPIFGMHTQASARHTVFYPGMGGVITSYSKSIAETYAAEFKNYPLEGSVEEAKMISVADLIGSEITKLNLLGARGCSWLKSQPCYTGMTSNARAVPFADREPTLKALVELRISLEEMHQDKPFEADDSRLRISELPTKIRPSVDAMVEQMIRDKEREAGR